MSTLSTTAFVAALAFSIATLGGAGCDRGNGPTSSATPTSQTDQGAGASCAACGGNGSGVLLAQVGPPVPGPTPTPGPSPTPGPVPTPTPPPTPSPPPVPTPPPPVPGPPPVGGAGGARSASADPFALPTVVQIMAYR